MAEASSAMDEEVLTPDLPSNPLALQRMGPFLLSPSVAVASRTVAYSAGNRRRSPHCSLSPAREEDEPDRWGPPVGDPAYFPSGAELRVRFPPRKAYFS